MTQMESSKSPGLPDPVIREDETEEPQQPSTAVSKSPLAAFDPTLVVKKKSDRPRVKKSSKLKKQKVTECESEDQGSLKLQQPHLMLSKLETEADLTLGKKSVGMLPKRKSPTKTRRQSKRIQLKQ